MANAEQIKALVRTHAQGDDTRFYAIALQIAAKEARVGNARVADELRRLVDEAKAGSSSAKARAKIVSIAQPRGDLAGLLSVSHPKLRLADMVLAPGVAEKIKRILDEQRQQDRIREHGFAPRRKILLVGPPGTGKTMTAGVLAGELSLALFSIQLHALITKFMGETAAKLRLIFDAIAESRAVYFFDEFDALGGERAAANDVGEMRRVLGSFLQFLEQDRSESLIVAATNNPVLLDRALFRRFDAVVDYELPDTDLAEQVLKARLATIDTGSVSWKQVVEAASGLSQADLARAAEEAAKTALLARRKGVDTAVLVAALADRRTGSR